MPERSRYQVQLIEGCGCQVLVTGENGHRETWAGFNDEREAQSWIAFEMAKRSKQAKKDWLEPKRRAP